MKLYISLFVLFIALCFALSSCGIFDFGSDTDEEHSHVWSEANCYSPKHCECGMTEGEPLSHIFADRDCLRSKKCTLCGFEDGDPLGHDMTESTCTDSSRCRRPGCEYVLDNIKSHSLESVYEDGKLSFVCRMCDKSMKVENFYYLDGTNHKGIDGVMNKGSYTTVEGTDLPVINNGVYELISLANGESQFQAWVPSKSSSMTGFGSDNYAAGFLSFSIDIYTTRSFYMYFVDTQADAERWSEEWCLRKPFLQITTPYGINGEIGVSLFGWDDQHLADVMIDPNVKFTGWIDVIVGIILDPNTDMVTLRYYVNGEYAATASKEITTLTNAINSVYFNGVSSVKGSGMRLDNIAFGYSENAEWIFDREPDEHVHKFTDATCTMPKVCIYCSALGSDPLGHTYSDPTITNIVPSTCTERGSYDITRYCTVCKTDLGVTTVSTDPLGHSLIHICDGELLTYGCARCEAVFVPENQVYLDGGGYDGMRGVTNSGNYSVADGTQLPSINNGSYELINMSGVRSQAQLWVSAKESKNTRFSSENSASGFFSFRFNVYMDYNFEMKFVDEKADADRWSKEWCIKDAFFKVSVPMAENGKLYVNVTGWDGIELCVIEVAEDNLFTGWHDVKVAIDLNPDNDTITLSYYMDGEYKSSVSKELTTVTNAISSVYINGNSTSLGCGILLDDISFAYSESNNVFCVNS